MQPSIQHFVEQHTIFSRSTFGDDCVRGPIGSLKHLEKEALEAQDKPDDIIEYADIGMLWLDSFRRAGFTFEQVLAAMYEKLEVNKNREWDNKGNDEPVYHKKNEPPVNPFNNIGVHFSLIIDDPQTAMISFDNGDTIMVRIMAHLNPEISDKGHLLNLIGNTFTMGEDKYRIVASEGVVGYPEHRARMATAIRIKQTKPYVSHDDDFGANICDL